MGAQAPAPPSFLFFFPALIFPAVFLLELFRGLGARGDAFALYAVHDSTLDLLAVLCFGAALALAAWPEGREAAVKRLDKPTGLPWLLLTYAGLAGWFLLTRWRQYHGFMLPQDTANAVTAAWNFLKTGHAFRSVEGIDAFSQHFVALLPLASPLLLIWKSPLALVLLETAVVASAPLAVYALTGAVSGSGLAACCGLLLAASSPSLFELLTASLHNNAMAAFLPWAGFFWVTGRRTAALAALVLLLLAGEQAPFVLFGLGLFLVFTKERKLGAAVCAGAAVLWLAELSLLSRLAAREATGHTAFNKMDLFRALVPEGTPSARVLPEVALHPLRTLGALFDTPKRLYAAARLVISTGLFALVSPVHAVPFLVAVLPHVLAYDGAPISLFGAFAGASSFWNLTVHYSAPVWGPLFWAAAYGLKRAHEKLAPRGAQGWLLVWCLLFAALGFRFANRTLIPGWLPRWTQAMPRVMAKIPPDARVWTEEYATAPLSTRRYLTIVGYGPGEPAEWHRLFRPDYVLFDWNFLCCSRSPHRERVLTFLAREGYLKEAEDEGIFLFKAPKPSEPELASLPEADEREAMAYLLKVVRYKDDPNILNAELNSTRRALELEPDNLPLLYNLALGQLKQGVWEDAAGTYRRILSLCPTCASAKVNLGLALTMAGKLGDAESAYREALMGKVGAEQSRNNLALIAVEQGRFDEGRKLLEQNLRENGPSELTHYNLGLLYTRMNDVKNAEAHYRKSLKLDPNAWKSHHNLGILLEKKGDFDGAKKHFERAVAVNPLSAHSLRYLGSLIARREDPVRALPYYEAAVRAAPSDSRARAEFGVLLAGSGRKDAACAQLNEALRLNPAEPLHPEVRKFVDAQCRPSR